MSELGLVAMPPSLPSTVVVAVTVKSTGPADEEKEGGKSEKQSKRKNEANLRGCGRVGGGNNEGGIPNSPLDSLMFTREMIPEADWSAAAEVVAKKDGRAKASPLEPPPVMVQMAWFSSLYLSVYPIPHHRLHCSHVPHQTTPICHRAHLLITDF